MTPLIADLVAVVAQTDGSESSGGSIFGLLVPLVLVGGVFYLFMVAPQRRRNREMQKLRDEVSVGDEVRTVGGILGVVAGIEDEVVVLDVGGGTTMRFARRAIAERLGGDEA